MAVSSVEAAKASEPQAARGRPAPAGSGRATGWADAPATLLSLQRTAGNSAVVALLARRASRLQRQAHTVQRQAATVQRAPTPPVVTAVNAPAAELGVGRRMTATADVTPAGKSAPKWALVGAPAGVTVVPTGRRAVIQSRPPVAGAPVGGASFTVTAAFSTATPVASSPIMMVEITGATFNATPAFGATFATAIGSASPPANSADPNAQGVTGNTSVIVPATLPAGRVPGVVARGAPGVGIAGLVVTPTGATGRQTLRLTDPATGTFLDQRLLINSMPNRVSGFGAQTSALPTRYGAFNIVQFGASDPSGAGSRPIAEIITVVKDDFAFGAPFGGAGTPALAFSAPANNWSDLNGTSVAAIDINSFVGPGVPQLPRQIIYRQQFFWMSWTGTFATTALATGSHRRTLVKVGNGFRFQTEQFFPGAAAKLVNDRYAGPPLIVLKPIAFAPATIAADGLATSNVTVPGTVPPRTLNWSVLSGGSSLTLTTGAGGLASGTRAVVTAGTVPGVAQVQVADSVFPNRAATGTIRVVGVKLGAIAAPRAVKAGASTATVSVNASPGGRVVDFSVDAGATVGPTTVAGNVHSAVLTRTAGFTGVVTVTAADHALPAKTATARINFK